VFINALTPVERAAAEKGNSLEKEETLLLEGKQFD
jgi:hypothetical protein